MEKFIVIKGEAATNKNTTDRLDNACNIVPTYAMAEEDAMEFLKNGAITVEIYQLEATLSVTEVARVRGGIIDNLKLKK